jgi:hypothetical protein
MKTSRGRVLRDTAVGDGLLAVEGAQLPFKLEGLWKSDHAPKVDMAVDVDFDDSGTMVAIRAVDPTALARERAARLAANAGETAKLWAAELKTRGAPALAELRAKGAPALADLKAQGLPVLMRYVQLVGAATLIALAALVLGWFFLPAVSIDFLGSREAATFYDYLRVLNNPRDGIAALERSSAGAGIYGFFCIVALFVPLAPHFVKLRQLWLAYCAPLTWIAVAVLIGYWKARSAMNEAYSSLGAFGGDVQDLAGGMAREFMNELWEAVSLGSGTYLAAAAALYLAWVGLRRFRAR